VSHLDAAVTETDEIAHALDLARERWAYERNRRRLLLRLIEDGERVVRLDEEARVGERRETSLRHSGATTGT
jgi:hypothetical protein